MMHEIYRVEEGGKTRKKAVSVSKIWYSNIIVNYNLTENWQ